MRTETRFKDKIEEDLDIDLNPRKRKRKSSENNIDDLFAEPPVLKSENSFLGRVIYYLIALIFLSGVSFFLFKTFISGDHSNLSSSIPLIRADDKPLKVPPKDPGGMYIPNMDNTVYEAISKKPKEKLKEENILAYHENALSREDITAKLMERKSVYKSAPASPQTPVIIEESAPPPAILEEEKPPISLQEFVEKKEQEVVEKKKQSSIKEEARVMLGAFPSQELADKHWEKLTQQNPNLLTGHKKSYGEKSGENGVVTYTLRIVFSDIIAARKYCEKLKSNQIDCFVVKVSGS